MAPKGRLLSLDVFRGATIAAMILVNNPGSWNHVFAPLLHAEWHGWTFTDAIFPFFLWISGAAMTLSFARRVERGEDRGRLLAHAARRAAIIFAIGLFLNAFPRFDLAPLRIPGVLQRIAICYLAAAALYLFAGRFARAVWTVGLMAVYWALMTLVPVPGIGSGFLGKQGNFAQWVDSLVLSGHMWSQTKTWDPEGVVSTLPAIATVMFGVFTGEILRGRRTPAETASWIFTWGAALLWAGQLFALWMPINKNLWTVPFALFMAGLAAVAFAACFWLVDAQGWRRGTQPFAIYGMNAIMVYVLSGMLGDVLSVTGAYGWLWVNVFSYLGPPKFGSLLFAIANVLVLYAAAWYLYRRKWFVRF